MNRIGLQLEPLDVLFFRDGRPFGTATRGQSGLPTPQTLLGALRLAMLERYCPQFAAFRHQADRPKTWDQVCVQADAPPWLRQMGVRGPWLARLFSNGALDVLVSAPAVLHTRKKAAGNEVYRAVPLRANQLPGWDLSLPEQQSNLRPLWLTSDEVTERADGYLTFKGLQTFLRGDRITNEMLIKPEDLFGFDHRTGIGIDADRLVAEESMIYGASFLALRPRYTPPQQHEEPREPSEVMFYAEVVRLDDTPKNAFDDLGILSLGGERRRVAVRSIDAVQWPNIVPTGQQKPLLLLTTSALFQARWRPTLQDGQLVAAAVPNPIAVSGWDLARGGPKPTRFAVPAGSVYFLNSLTTTMPDSLSDQAEDCLQGWGCYLRGVWTDA